MRQRAHACTHAAHEQRTRAHVGMRACVHTCVRACVRGLVRRSAACMHPSMLQAGGRRCACLDELQEELLVESIAHLMNRGHILQNTRRVFFFFGPLGALPPPAPPPPPPPPPAAAAGQLRPIPLTAQLVLVGHEWNGR